MAVMNLTLKYKSPRARLVYIIMMACLPIWEIGAPIAIGYIIGLVMSKLMSLPFTFVVTSIPLLFALIAISILITAVAEDNRIHLSKDGLSFPLFLLPQLKYRRARLWTDLTNATVTEQQNLIISFNDGTSLLLQTKLLNQSDLEQMLLAVEMWGTNCNRSEQLIEFQNRIQSQDKGNDKVGYTQMWEEELARRFQTTAFIPLEPGHLLCKGRIKVLKQLAFGGLSAIYLAQENDLDLVVIKEAVVP